MSAVRVVASAGKRESGGEKRRARRVTTAHGCASWLVVGVTSAHGTVYNTAMCPIGIAHAHATAHRRGNARLDTLT